MIMTNRIREVNVLKTNEIYNIDCLVGIDEMLKQGLQADLIVTDPPYLIRSTKAGGKSDLARSIQPMNDELENGNLTRGIEEVHLKAMWDVMKVPNIYMVQRSANPTIYRVFRKPTKMQNGYYRMA